MSGFAASLEKEKLRDELAAAVVSRIRGQAAGAPADVKAVLEGIADRLFDEDLLDDLKKWLPEDRRELRRELRQATGASGRAFVIEARLEVARRLLRELGTGITVAEAGRLVGFAVLPNFKHAFKYRFGVSPGAWRDLSAPAAEVATAPGLETCRRILTGPWPKAGGSGDYELGRELLHHLGCGYSGVGEAWTRLFGMSGESLSGESLSGESLSGESPPFRVEALVYEAFKAASVLEAVREEPLPSGLAGVRYPVPMGSLLLFELLRRGVLNGVDCGVDRGAEGRDARLALASLDACVERLAPLVPEYQALALVSLAREAFGRGAIEAAQTTLTLAAAYRSQARPFSAASVEAPFLETKAELRLHGGAVTEAFELASRAAGLYRRLGRRPEAARCLLLRERARRGAVTPPEVAELEEALAGVEPGAAGSLVFRLGGELAAAYACQGRLDAATSTLGRLRDLINTKE